MFKERSLMSIGKYRIDITYKKPVIQITLKSRIRSIQTLYDS